MRRSALLRLATRLIVEGPFEAEVEEHAGPRLLRAPGGHRRGPCNGYLAGRSKAAEGRSARCCCYGGCPPGAELGGCGCHARNRCLVQRMRKLVVKVPEPARRSLRSGSAPRIRYHHGRSPTRYAAGLVADYQRNLPSAAACFELAHDRHRRGRGEGEAARRERQGVDAVTCADHPALERLGASGDVGAGRLRPSGRLGGGRTPSRQRGRRRCRRALEPSPVGSCGRK